MMSRHRKIDVRMWGDAKFRSLSAAKPNAQTLWVYLLTGPHTTSIPGLFMAGQAALAEALNWPLEGFREAFSELLNKGMVKADWKARVVFVPNAILYNQPESINVIKSWRIYWDEIAECQLKVEAHQRLKAFLEGIGEGWAQTFISYCARARFNQEQEQEQDKTPLPPKGESDGFKSFWTAYPRKQAKPNAQRAWKKLKPGEELTAIILAAVERQRNSDEWRRENGRFIPLPASWLNARRWEDEPTVLFREPDPDDIGEDTVATIRAQEEFVRREREELAKKQAAQNGELSDAESF